MTDCGVAAIKYLESNPAGTPVDEAAFDKECGVGALTIRNASQGVMLTRNVRNRGYLE